jgi:hypothetical protein
VVDDIKAWSHDADALTLAWDCIATEDSARICAAALSTTREGHYRSLLRLPDAAVKKANAKVDNGMTLAYTMFGEPFDKGIPTPAVPADFEYGVKFWELARELLAAGKIKPAKADVNRGGKGLDGVLVGLKELKDGKVSGAKLVYTL